MYQRSTVDEEASAAARVDALEGLFGDPLCPDNPLGHTALLSCDQAGELSAEGEAALREFGVPEEFIPVAMGGRLDRLDTLVRVLRPVFRRDAALGLAQGVTPFMAALTVWLDGTEDQRRWTAGLLRRGAAMTVAYQEMAHGNDFVRNGFRARTAAAGFRLQGRKEAIVNAGRAQGLVIFSRVPPRLGGGSHSVLLVDKTGLPQGGYRHLPRYRTRGVLGCDISGLEFHDCPVPGEALIGAPGDGVASSLRSFQITRGVVPGMVFAGADSALRTVVGFTLAHRDARRRVLDVPRFRAVLAGAFTDLLICDSLALAGTRAVHLLPEDTSVSSAVVQYLLPKVLIEALYDVSVVLGADSFGDSGGGHGAFYKHVRDLPVTTLGHTGSAACLATIIPQLSRLAARSWASDQDAAPPELFQPHSGLPPLQPARLSLAADRDPLAASLLAGSVWLANERGATDLRAARGLVAELVRELRWLQGECAGLSPRDFKALAHPHAYALADRYALVLAGAACLGVWREAGDASFLADPAWLAMALGRIIRRLGRPAPNDQERPDVVFHELLDRYRGNRSFDLYDTALAGPARH